MRRSNAVLLAMQCVSIKPCPGADETAKRFRSLRSTRELGVSHPLQIIDFDVQGPIDTALVHLVDDGGRPIAFQVVENASKIAVQTDLSAPEPALKADTWSTPAGISSDLLVKEIDNSDPPIRSTGEP